MNNEYKTGDIIVEKQFITSREMYNWLHDVNMEDFKSEMKSKYGFSTKGFIDTNTMELKLQVN